MIPTSLVGDYLMYYYDKNPKLTLLLLDQNMRKLLLSELKRRVEF